MSPFVPLHEARAKELMERHGLDAIVAASPVNIAYLTGYRWWLDPLFKDYMVNPGGSDELVFPGYAVLPLESPAILVVNSFLAMTAANLESVELHVFGQLPLAASPKREGWSTPEQRIAEVLSGPQHETPTVALAHALGARGLHKERLGVELGALTYARRDALAEALPGAALLDCTNVLRLIRAVKTPDEIELLATAATIAEKAVHETLRGARPGDRLGQLVDEFRTRLADEGAELDHLLFGASGLGITTNPSHVLAEDDVANVDWGCVYEHYYSDAGSTFTMCEPSPGVSQRFESLGSCIDAGARELVAGARASETHRAMIDALEASGVHDAFAPSGHGLGLDVRDYPIVMADNGLRIQDDCVDEPSDLPLEENMVIALEVSQYEPGLGSFNHERVFVVTDRGGRELIAYDRGQTVHPRAQTGRQTARRRGSSAIHDEKEAGNHSNLPAEAVV